MTDNSNRTSWIVRVALLTAVSSVMMFLEMSVPFMPPFLKFDFSDIPSLLAGFSMGPLAGVTVVILKNLVHAITSWSFLVGEFANTLIGIAFVLPAAIIYKRNKCKKNAIIGMIVGSLIMTILAALMNYFLLIPLYATVLGFPVEAIIEMSNSVNPMIVDLKTLILIGVTPFNLFKAIINTIITAIVYKKLSPILHAKPLLKKQKRA